MALALPHLSWWLWSGKQQKPKISDRSSLNSLPDSGLWEMKSLEFHRKTVKRKWHSREERRIDREHDVVIVSSDGGCLSGSDSDGSDWSIGWLEPYGPGFQSDDDNRDSSFAVLVPCYRHGQNDLIDSCKDVFTNAIGNIADINTTQKKKYMEQWVSSL